MNFRQNDGYDGSYDPRSASFHSRGSRSRSDDGMGRGSGAQGGDFGANASDFDRFRGKSEDELMSDLLSAVNRMKREGSFDPVSLDRLYATAYPFLSEQQRQRMSSIINMLKG